MGGGYVMHRLEHPHELAVGIKLQKQTALVHKYLDNCSVAGSFCPDLFNKTLALLERQEQLIKERGHYDNLRWDYPGGVLFCATVMSTIG
jgi:hypothetical protein